MNPVYIIYNKMLTSKKKERFEIILEPLQALLQLAFLSFCPVETKLTLQQNLLYLQPPSWVQGLLRTYYSDGRDDVYFLFHVIHRFNKFYAFLQKGTTEEQQLFELLKTLSKIGLDNLILTYSHTDKPALLHTLQMYKSILDNPESYPIQENSIRDSEENVKTVDEVFIKITDLYTKDEYKIIFHTLSLMQKNKVDYMTYITGLNAILDPINQKIKKWISDNIVF